MKKNFNKKGILFWITGLSGSGKTSIAKKIIPFIKKKYGPTIHLDGDDLRKILNFNGYSFKERLSYSLIYAKIAKHLTDQGINVVFSLVALINKPRSWNRKNIKKYVEIYIKADLEMIIKKGKKKIYQGKKNIVGVSIKPEFPIKPHISVNNTFDRSLKIISSELCVSISKLINKNKY
tara:strand:- start:436 stop:969 length:534 start_codon:yes stop_codon:yes gene_type:complete